MTKISLYEKAGLKRGNPIHSTPSFQEAISYEGKKPVWGSNAGGLPGGHSNEWDTQVSGHILVGAVGYQSEEVHGVSSWSSIEVWLSKV